MLLPHEALGERIAELSAHINAAKSRLLELIAQFDEGRAGRSRAVRRARTG